jgi:hypothetical protein
MSDQEIPQDLADQLAPGGRFPGEAATFAVPVGSDRPVRVRIGQADNRHLQLSREEYRVRAVRQKEIDAQANADANPNQEPPASMPAPKKRGRPRGSKNKPKPPAAAQAPEPSGPPCPAPSMTAAHSPIPIPTNAMLEQRVSRLEQGVDKIIDILTNPRIAEEPDLPNDDELDVVDDEMDEQDDPDDLEFEPEPGESFDDPPQRVVATPVENDAVFDKGLRDLQQMILKRNPQKQFRQSWYNLTRAAQYNNWPPERREAFDQLFNSIVVHPKFVYHMAKFLRGSRNGNCVGNEQIARVCGMVAGFLCVYQLATAGQ